MCTNNNDDNNNNNNAKWVVIKRAMTKAAAKTEEHIDTNGGIMKRHSLAVDVNESLLVCLFLSGELARIASFSISFCNIQKITEGHRTSQCSRALLLKEFPFHQSSGVLVAEISLFA
jgi:hypothetical protein